MLDDATKERIEQDIKSEDVVLYMKGTPVFPQCGFSAAVVGVLTHLNVPFRGINVLEDDSVREGIKSFSDWPTIPQLYVKGEFVGGCDSRSPRTSTNQNCHSPSQSLHRVYFQIHQS